MMNIGVVVDNDFNSDVRVRKEVSILQKEGFNVHVLCFAFDKKTYSDIEGIKIQRIKMKKRIKNVIFFFFNRFPLYEYIWKNKIRKFIVDNSIEILHVHDLYMSKSAYLGVKLSKLNVKIVLDLHENYPIAIQSYNWTRGTLRNFISKPKAWLKKEGEYLKYASKVIVLSDYFKKDLLLRYNFLNSNDIIPFPNVIDISLFESFKIDNTIKKSEKVTLFYFGAVAERRGIFETLEAFRLELVEGLNIELLIVGPVDKADRARFFNAINHYELKSFITYIPWIDISELVTYLSIIDICLSPLIKNPQHESGVANKIYQYMYGGKPIIVSDCKPQKELIESFDCGLVYSTQIEFRACIKTLVNDQKLREKLGKNGLHQLYLKYDDRNYEEILLSIYKQ